jgi:hypothetical protein
MSSLDRLAAAVAEVRSDNLALLRAEQRAARLVDLRRLGQRCVDALGDLPVGARCRAAAAGW